MTPREQILFAARSLLLRGGPRAVTIHAIAAEVGVSAPAIYKHWRARESILAALAEEAWEMFRTALAAAMSAPDAKARLLRTGDAYLAFGLAEPQRYRLLFMSDEEAPARADEPAGQPVGAGLAFLVDRLRECQSAGVVSAEVDAYELAVAYWATCHGLVSLYLAGGGAQRFEIEAYRRLSARSLRLVLGLVEPARDAGSSQ